MKTQVTHGMKQNIFSFLEHSGIPLNYILNGLIGGFIWSLYKKEKFWSAVRQVIIGGVISGYFTPVIIAKTSMSSPYVGFTSFIIGMLGMVIVDTIYKQCIKWLRKFKLIEEILFKK